MGEVFRKLLDWAVSLLGSPKQKEKAETKVVVEKEYVRPDSRSEAVSIYRELIETIDGDVSHDLIFAICWMESGFNPKSYRYEPNYDFKYIYDKQLMKKPAYLPYLCTDKTVEQWFAENERRQREKKKDRDYNFPAQLRVAASYGICQLMFPTAVGLGFTGEPEGLYNPEEGIKLGCQMLWRQMKRYNGNKEDAIAAYNAGSAKKRADGKYRNQHYVSTVLSLQKQFKELL